MSDDDYPSAREAALAALHAGDAEAGWRALRPLVSYPRVVPIAELDDAIAVLGPIFVALGARALAERAAEASVAPGDAERLYAFGYQCIEDGLAPLAVTVLARGVELAPDNEALVTELVAALEAQLAYRDAANVLAARPALVESSFLCRYLMVFDSIMCGDLATARDVLPKLVPAEHAQERLAARVQAMLARADRVGQVSSLDGRDLRGWHQVITGGILLHRSPYGFDEPMHGRYAWLQDSWAMIRHGLERLRAVLAVWGWQPPCVYAPPGRDHEAVAGAAATMFDVPLAPWPAVGAPAPGLVVAYDLATVAPRELERLAQRRRDQVLHAHVTLWTDDAPVAAEVTTLLAQRVIPPWGRQVVLDAESGAAKEKDEDERDAEALAAAIVAAPALGGDDDDFDDEPGLLALARLTGMSEPGPRERGWAGSPVPSNRFP